MKTLVTHRNLSSQYKLEKCKRYFNIMYCRYLLINTLSYKLILNVQKNTGVKYDMFTYDDL